MAILNLRSATETHSITTSSPVPFFFWRQASQVAWAGLKPHTLPETTLNFRSGCLHLFSAYYRSPEKLAYLVLEMEPTHRLWARPLSTGLPIFIGQTLWCLKNKGCQSIHILSIKQIKQKGRQVGFENSYLLQLLWRNKLFRDQLESQQTAGNFP